MTRLSALVCLLCLGCVQAAAATLQQISEPVVNDGFEKITPGQAVPDGWEFVISRNAKASAAVDLLVSRMGKRSVRLANASSMSPNVYGRLRQTVPVLPATEYVLSAWVKGQNVASGQHFTDWKTYRLALPRGTFDWVKLSARFTTMPGQTTLDLGLNIVNTAAALWVDDVRLRPVLTRLKTTRRGLQALICGPGQVIGDGQDVDFSVLVEAPPDFAGRAVFTAAAGWQTLSRQELPARSGEIKFTWNSGETDAPEITCRVTILDAQGNKVAEGEKTVQKISAVVISAQLDQVQAGLSALKEEVRRAREAGAAVDYPVITHTVVERFLEWTREDVQRGETVRASYAARDMLRSLKRASEELASYRRDPAKVPPIARYVTGKLEIAGTSFIGDVRRGGRTERGPAFFTGYGHFGQVRSDIEIFPDYGINIIQIELGPARVLTSETDVSNATVEDALNVLERAAKSNIMVNILLSPHYFPQWALEKWPHLASCSGGFIHFCIDAPESRQVIEKFLRHVIPQLRGRPALHSLCLSNEPIYTESRKCAFTRKMWEDYLARKHGTITGLNAALRTEYASFADVPIPPNDEFASPVFYDWCVFNQERFSGWHKWMAYIIHEMAPEIPVHAKIMPTIWNRNDIAYGVDPEQFCALGQIAGNDCWIPYPGSGEWAAGWQTQNQFYDLLRSMNRQPIFNSENHISADRSTHYYPPEHFRTALWQGAIHGQGATTIWVWERTYDAKSDFYGNVMHRPGCAEEVGRTGLDLMRLAPEVTALQEAPSPVAILYSVASIARCPQYLDELGAAYQALNFSGAKVAFISENQAASGKLKSCRLLIVPGACCVKDETFAAIAEFARSGGRVVGVGEDLLSRDEYGRPRSGSAALRWTLRLAGGANSRDLHGPLLKALAEAGVGRVECIEVKTGKPAWGVEWLPAEYQGALLINAVNLTNKPVRVEFREGASRLAGLTDLITGRRKRTPLTLQPLQPVLLKGAAAR